MDIETALKGISGGKNPFAYSDLGVFFSKAIEIMMLFAAIASFVYLVWGGLEWILSGGDKTGTEKAKSKITDSIIGLVIVFSSWAIFQIIQNFFGFQVTTNTTPTETTSTKTETKSSCVVATKEYNWVLAKNSSCIKKEGVDWNGCWRTHITKFPCDNFYIKGDDYWWNLHKECSKPGPLCP